MSRIPNRTALVHTATLSKHGKDPERAKRSVCPQDAHSGAVHADPYCAEEMVGTQQDWLPCVSVLDPSMAVRVISSVRRKLKP